VFPISEEASRLLDCDDFREHRGLQLFEMPERERTVREKPRQETPSGKEKESKIRKFFRKIFGKKNDKDSGK
jgi:chorismate mutase